MSDSDDDMPPPLEDMTSTLMAQQAKKNQQAKMTNANQPSFGASAATVNQVNNF